ncbi:putative lipid II flippase FtsW [bacterium]|jgi:cell division protein FtsW|nr:putative lipid II flippase FtsW [bacterium]
MSIDKTLIFIVIAALLGMCVVMVYSTSALTAEKKWNDEYYYLKKQVMWIAVGIFIFFAMSFINYNFWRKISWFLFFGTIVMLSLVLIPGIGRVAGGARQWLSFGPINIQPSEIAKLTILIFMADLLDKQQNKIKEFRKGFIPPFLVLILICALVGGPDFGTAVLIALVIFSMLVVSGISLKYLLLSAVFFLPMIAGLIKMKAYRFKRILIFLDPWSDSRGAGWQLIQSFIALGSGGLAGQGLGNSIQKMGFLPESHTDFIFSIIGEETGFLGGALVIICFIALILSGSHIAYRCKNFFGHILAMGIVFTIGYQAIINIGVATGCMPVTGLPLPMISYGGSNLVVCMAFAGILFNIATEQEQDIRGKIKSRRVVKFGKHK